MVKNRLKFEDHDVIDLKNICFNEFILYLNRTKAGS